MKKTEVIKAIQSLPQPFGNVLATRLDNLLTEEDFIQENETLINSFEFPASLLYSCFLADGILKKEVSGIRLIAVSKELGLGMSDLKNLKEWM